MLTIECCGNYERNHKYDCGVNDSKHSHIILLVQHIAIGSVVARYCRTQTAE
jgi:hypothetical protein